MQAIQVVARRPVYTSQGEFPQEIDHVLVMYCSDPYYRRAVEEFLQEYLGLGQYDLLVMPSGPANILQSSLTFISDRPRVKFLHEKHKIEKVIGIAHLNCLHYKQRYPALDEQARRQKQEDDLRHFSETVAKVVPGVETQVYFAQEVDGHVQFTRVG